MDHCSFDYFPHNESRQLLDPYEDQALFEAGAPASTSVQPLALHEEANPGNGHDAALGIHDAQTHGPAPLSSPSFSYPIIRYSAQHQAAQNAYIAGAHGSYHFNADPTPNSFYIPLPAYESHMPGTIRGPLRDSATPSNGMLPPLCSPLSLSPVPAPPGTAISREQFRAQFGGVSRSDLVNQNSFYQPRSPHTPFMAMSRPSHPSTIRQNPPASNHYNNPTPMELDTQQTTAVAVAVPGGDGPMPFEETKCVESLFDDRNRPVTLCILARIDKAFFKHDNDWTCYRRNYFGVQCAYDIRLENGNEPDGGVYVRLGNGLQRVEGFAVGIAACVDGEDSKPVELIQHTPKRDKGPTNCPTMRPLPPNPSGVLGPMPGTVSSPYSPASPAVYYPEQDSQSYSQPGPSSQPPPLSDGQTTTTFERIQFKKATANNGKRRAAQQYFHIVVEVFAKVRTSSSEVEWVRVAYRRSARMVVRGRSPGHYQESDRLSDPGGASGGAGGSEGGQRGFAACGSAPSLASPSFSMSGTFATSGGYHSRPMMSSDGMDYLPPLSSITTLENSSQPHYGRLTHRVHETAPYDLYGSSMHQTSGLFSTSFPEPPPARPSDSTQYQYASISPTITPTYQPPVERIPTLDGWFGAVSPYRSPAPYLGSSGGRGGITGSDRWPESYQQQPSNRQGQNDGAREPWQGQHRQYHEPASAVN